MNTKSTKKSPKSKRQKPDKPHADFPLTPHRNGQWCKKVKRKVYFFGVWEKPDAALKCWLEDKDAILAGRERPSKMRKGKTVEDITTDYLGFQEDQFEQGDIGRQRLKDCERVCKRICKMFGKQTPVASLTPEDFGRLKKRMSKTMSALTLGIEIQRVRSVFKFAYEDGLLDKPIKYGRQFDKPATKKVRKQKNERGSLMFEQSEIETLLANASTQMKAFILLGLNAGFGNHDCATLPIEAVDLENGWVSYARTKTQQPRRCPLWPETVKAMKEAAESRPAPLETEDKGLFFLTAHGRCWVRHSKNKKNAWTDSLGQEFLKLMRETDTRKPRRGFYALRHAFRTIADETLDPVAIDLIMGHTPDANDMSAHYRERIGDERLLAVSNHVRQWVFPKNTARKK